MDYKGYKLIDKIMLVCRDTSEHQESMYSRNDYQAYLVDPSNKKQLESARHWAKWTEYGPSIKNEETGKWENKYKIDHEPVEFEFDNNGFELELKDCAGGSSQGGKLSFWNCIVTKEDNRFVIGINSDMLLDLLKNATFCNGKCQSPLLFITNNGKVGMTVEGSDTYNQCIKDRELKDNMKKTQVSKFSFGDRVCTPTLDEVYLGIITRYYKFDAGRNADHSYCGWRRDLNLRECTITKLAKPVTYHMFEGFYHKDETLSSTIAAYEKSEYAFPDCKKTCPKRTIAGKLDIDCSEEEFKQRLFKKIYNLDEFVDHAKDNYIRSDDQKELFYYFLSKDRFGLGFEPFELDDKIMDLIKTYGINYVDETESA